MTAPLPSALAPRKEHGGIPEKRPGGGGLPPTRQSSHTQVRRLSHSSTRSADSTLNIFPCWGLAAPPHLARNRCRSGRGRVEGSGQPIWPLAHLVLGPRPPALVPRWQRLPHRHPLHPSFSFHSGRAPLARAPGHARSPASPPPALTTASADGPLRAVALRPARLPAARAPTPAPACLGARAPGPGGGTSARVLTEARQCACACARTPK